LCDPDLQDKTRCDLKVELGKIIREQREGVWVRAKAESLNNQDRPTKFLFKKEKEQAENRQIYCLMDSHREVTDTEGILAMCTSFYKDLLTADETLSIENGTYLSDLPRQDLEKTKYLGNPITYTECLQAIKHMKKDKSPGCDGLTAEFYKTFFPPVQSCIQPSILNLRFTCAPHGLCNGPLVVVVGGAHKFLFVFVISSKRSFLMAMRRLLYFLNTYTKYG
jgi:hypothetical protein